MNQPNQSDITVGRALREYWTRERTSAGRLAATKGLVRIGWEFLLDSLPSRKRRRYGDAEYDWAFRVDTTSATVSWRTRLLGLLHSAYQPIEPELFREILGSLGMDFREFTFIDIGSGKGRALLLAAGYPFRRVLSVELLPELHAVAKDNIRKFPVEKRACGETEAICGDATQFGFPAEPLVIFLFNPLPEAGLQKVVANLQASISENPRPVFAIYANPVFEKIVADSPGLTKISGTPQYSIFKTGK